MFTFFHPDGDDGAGDVDYTAPVGTEDEESASGEEESGEEDPQYLTQEQFNETLQRKQSQWERKIARNLGVSRIEEAADLVRAGNAVSKASGLKPGEVVSKLGAQQQQPVVQPGVGQQPVVNQQYSQQQLDRIEGLLEADQTSKVRKTQEADARKEFGELYDKHKDDVEDKAEELGVSLVDAAAIVLRPKTKEHLESQLRTKQQTQQRRKVEGSGEPPASKGKVDYAAVLSPAQKDTAQRMGISLDKYYGRLKAKGKIE